MTVKCTRDMIRVLEAYIFCNASYIHQLLMIQELSEDSIGSTIQKLAQGCFIEYNNANYL
jgi:hypothetical protein